jgi:hypothetical protein
MNLLATSVRNEAAISYVAETAKLSAPSLGVMNNPNPTGGLSPVLKPAVDLASAAMLVDRKVSPSLFDLRGEVDLAKLTPVTLPHDDASPQLVISTGNADDLVEITKGADNRIHVMVNGKEAWSGSPREFTRVRIETGQGNDTVINHVDGAVIDTGAGDDTVHNYGSHNLIITGSAAGGGFMASFDRDTVVSHGNDNTILTGFGDDRVTSTGDYNSIQTGDGIDTIRSTGHHNILDTGKGAMDGVLSAGNFNTIVSASDRANLAVEGNSNTIRVGAGNHMININGDHNRAEIGFGGSQVNAKGQDNVIRRTFLGALSGLFKNLG